ncbi:MAG: hypothetical protein WAM39_25420 [Bryobacteraceae bacterium]
MASEVLGESSKPFWRGHGLWRFPDFFRSVYVDAPQLGLGTAGELHYRRLTIERAARQLPTIEASRGGSLMPVYFMSGREHWAMTVFCAFSLLASTQANLAPVIMDDGTLDNEKRAELRRILPIVRFLDAEESNERVHCHLSPQRFPALHAMRNHLPLMKKLMDLHAGLTGWRLFVDSDVLFFREPEWMIGWLESPRQPVYMSDYQNSYGYPLPFLREVLGAPAPERVNTGFCGLCSEKIDWEQLEQWAARLHGGGGTNHFSEQCLTAMLIAKSGGEAAPRGYLIWPSADESRRPTAVMHHYVAESRTWYHILGWPGILRRAAQHSDRTPARILL